MSSASRWRGAASFLAAGVGIGIGIGYGGRSLALQRRKDKSHAQRDGQCSVFKPVTGYDFTEAMRESQLLAKEKKGKSKSPGMSVAVGVDGELVWAEGFGLADVENKLPCSPQSMMRLASISKPITMLLLARLWDAGLVDLDSPVQRYVPDFPEKTVDGEKVVITTRMLLHHISGIRHYSKKPTETDQAEIDNKKEEMSQKEYYITRHYDSVGESLELFANDSLLHKPGTKYAYTTHGWTLVSAVIEGAGGRPFLDQLNDMLFQLGLQNIQAELMDKLIDHRARPYQVDKRGRLRNAPYVDNSYKWAGGGLFANVEDVVHFGFRMLAAYFGQPLQECRHATHPTPCPQCSPYVKKETVKQMWTSHPLTEKTTRRKESTSGYGMGWRVRSRPVASTHGVATISHTGGAVGTSSALVIIPPGDQSHAVVVAVICNMESINLEPTARRIGQVFLQHIKDQEVAQRQKTPSTVKKAT